MRCKILSTYQKRFLQNFHIYTWNNDFYLVKTHSKVNISTTELIDDKFLYNFTTLLKVLILAKVISIKYVKS